VRRLLNGAPLVALRVLLLLLAALATRAPARRVLDALAGGVCVAAFTAGWDHLAHLTGWWSHPPGAPYGPSASPRAYYLGVGLWYGAGVGLLGWSITRRFGYRGTLAFLASLGAYGVVRDSVAARRFRVLSFGPGPGPLLADAIAWSSTAGAAQLVMRLLAGHTPPTRDRQT
jgi:hypothetical protein